MSKLPRKIGESRGKGKTQNDLLLYFLHQKDSVLILDVYAYCRKALNIGEKKSIYNHLNTLAKEGVLHKEVKEGLASKWHIPRDYITAQKLYQKIKAIVQSSKSETLQVNDLLRTEYFKNVVSDEFLEDATLYFLQNATTHAEQVSKKPPHTSQNLTYLHDSLERKILTKQQLVNLFIGKNHIEEAKEFLKSSSQAITFLLNPPEHREFWNWMIQFFFAESSIISKNAKNNNPLAYKKLLERQTPFFQAIHILFHADLLAWQISSTPFTKNYISKQVIQEEL